MYVHPRNSWDLKSCQQEPSESLWDYIRRFSQQCNSLPDVIDADVIGVFLSGTTYESLIHKLGCLKPRTTRDLLDVATNHASGEEVVRQPLLGLLARVISRGDHRGVVRSVPILFVLLAPLCGGALI